MKKLIEELGLTINEFSNLYKIPYNTVRQWYNGIRTAPPYIKKIIEELIELKKNIDKHLPLGQIYYHIGIKTKYGYAEYLTTSESTREMIERDYKTNYNNLKITKKNLIELL